MSAVDRLLALWVFGPLAGFAVAVLGASLRDIAESVVESVRERDWKRVGAFALACLWAVGLIALGVAKVAEDGQ